MTVAGLLGHFTDGLDRRTIDVGAWSPLRRMHAGVRLSTQAGYGTALRKECSHDGGDVRAYQGV
jgi:hypothetical protein